MNKKFKVLANLAIPVREDGKKVIGLNSDLHEQWMNNFAQLIIKETCDVLKKQGDNWEQFSKNPPNGQAHNSSAALFAAYRIKEDAIDALKEHFRD